MLTEHDILLFSLYDLYQLEDRIEKYSTKFWALLRKGRTPEETLAKLQELRKVHDKHFNNSQVSEYPAPIGIKMVFLMDEIRQKKLDTESTK